MPLSQWQWAGVGAYKIYYDSTPSTGTSICCRCGPKKKKKKKKERKKRKEREREKQKLCTSWNKLKRNWEEGPKIKLAEMPFPEQKHRNKTQMRIIRTRHSKNY